MAHPDDFIWNLGDLLQGDRALSPTSALLSNRRIGLMVTGGIAAFRTPQLVRELRRAGAHVQVYVTPTALQFVTRDALEWTSAQPIVAELDGRAQHVEHLPEVYLIAPASYSTINKIACGIADNAVTTTLASAIGHMQAGRARIVVAPTMHGAMVNSILRESLAKLANLGCIVVPPRGRDGKALLPEDATVIDAVASCLK